MKIQDVKPGSIIFYDGSEHIVSNIYHGWNMILVYDVHRKSRNIWGPVEVEVIGPLSNDISIKGNSDDVVLTSNGSILNMIDSRKRFVSLRPVIKDLYSVRAGSMIEHDGEKYIVSTVKIDESILVYSLAGVTRKIPDTANVKVLRSSNENDLLIPSLDQIPEKIVKGQMFSIGDYSYLAIGAISKPSLLTSNGSILNIKDIKYNWIK